MPYSKLPLTKILEKKDGRIKKMVIYQDDIPVCIGATSEELHDKVETIMKMLSKAGMAVNEEKCVFKSKETKFLSYCTSISAHVVRPDTKLVEKRPMNKHDLESFLG